MSFQEKYIDLKVRQIGGMDAAGGSKESLRTRTKSEEDLEEALKLASTYEDSRTRTKSEEDADLEKALKIARESGGGGSKESLRTRTKSEEDLEEALKLASTYEDTRTRTKSEEDADIEEALEIARKSGDTELEEVLKLIYSDSVLRQVSKDPSITPPPSISNASSKDPSITPPPSIANASSNDSSNGGGGGMIRNIVKANNSSNGGGGGVIRNFVKAKQKIPSFIKEVSRVDKVIHKKGDNFHDNCISRSPQVWICKYNVGNEADLVDVVFLSSGYEEYIRSKFSRFCELYDQLEPIFEPFFKPGETDFTKLTQTMPVTWENANKPGKINESERFKTKLYNQDTLVELLQNIKAHYIGEGNYSDLKYSGPLRDQYDTIVLLHNKGLTDNQKDIVVLVALKMYMLADRNIQRDGISNQDQWYEVNRKIIDLCTQEDHGSTFHVQKRCIAQGENIYHPYLEWLGTLFNDAQVHLYIQSAINRAIIAYPSIVSINLKRQAELDNFLYEGGENALVLHLVRTRDSIRRVVKWIDEGRDLEGMLAHLQNDPKGQAVNKIFQDAFNFLFWETNDNGDTFTQKNIDPVKFLWERILISRPTPDIKKVMDIAEIVYSDGDPDWLKNIKGGLNKKDLILTIAADGEPNQSGDEGTQKQYYRGSSSLVINFQTELIQTEMKTVSYGFQDDIVSSRCSLELYGRANEHVDLKFADKTVFQLGAIVSALRLYLNHVFSADENKEYVLKSFLYQYVDKNNFADIRLIETLVQLVDHLRTLHYLDNDIIEIVNLLVWNAKNFGDAQLEYIINMGFSIIGTTLDKNSLLKLLKNKVPVITGFSEPEICIWGEMTDQQIELKHVDLQRSTYKYPWTCLTAGKPELHITGTHNDDDNSNSNSNLDGLDRAGSQATTAGGGGSPRDRTDKTGSGSDTEIDNSQPDPNKKKYFKYKAKYLQLKNNLIARKL